MDENNNFPGVNNTTGQTGSAAPVHQYDPNSLMSTSPLASTQPVNGGRKGKIIGALIAVVILAAAGSAYAAYSKGYTLVGTSFVSPQQAFDKFLSKGFGKIYKNSFAVSYMDKGTMDSSSSLGFSLKDIKLNVDGSVYINASNASAPLSSSNIKYTFGTGSTSFSAGLEYRFINNDIYFNVGDIPFISGAIGQISQSGKNPDWVKINLDELKQLSDSLGGSSSADVAKMNAFGEKLHTIWENKKIMTMKQFLGREKINEVSTLHFSANLDKAALKQGISESITSMADMGTTPLTDNDRKQIELVAASLLDKLEIKTFDLWIGANDSEIYKLNVASNAPSFVSLGKSIEADMKAAPVDPNDQAAIEKQIKDFFAKLDYSAQFNVTSTYSDYGKVMTVEAPSGAVDLIQLFKDSGAGAMLQSVLPIAPQVAGAATKAK
jgi:hypothetical protein